jgi:hypothetical protein
VAREPGCSLALAGVVVAVPAPVLDSHAYPRWIAAVQIVCWLGVLSSFLFGYCEFRADGLLVRQLGRKTLIVYDSPVELKPRPDAFGVLAVTDFGGCVLIPVALTPGVPQGGIPTVAAAETCIRKPVLPSNAVEAVPCSLRPDSTLG